VKKFTDKRQWARNEIQDRFRNAIRIAIVGALGIVGLVAGLAANAAPLLPDEAISRAATHTALATQTQEIGGREVIVYTAQVGSDDGKPATGAVTMTENGRVLAGAALDSEGKAEIRYDALPAGDHTLTAMYGGDLNHAASQSEGVKVHPDTSGAPAFTLGIDVVGSSTPATMTVAVPGETGYLNATVTPNNGFTGFLSLSCSGPSATSGAPGGSALPVGVSCTFTPVNLEIISSAAVTANMSLQTTAGQQNVAGSDRQPRTESRAPKLALAWLLPGILGLGFLGRKRKLFARGALLALVAAVGVLGTSSCAARYKYLNHGPTFTGTLPGTYTITITAQTSDGVTASAQSQTLTLVVK